MTNRTRFIGDESDIRLVSPPISGARAEELLRLIANGETPDPKTAAERLYVERIKAEVEQARAEGVVIDIPAENPEP